MRTYRTYGQHVPPSLRTMRMILIALVAGVSAFAGYVLYRGPAAPPPGADAEPNLGVIMLIAAVPPILLRFIVPPLMVRSMVRRLAGYAEQKDEDDSEDLETALTGVLQTRLIVANALLEGSAFMVWYGYMTEGFLPCAIVGGLLPLGMLADFPTQGRLDAFVADQKRRMKEDRLFG